MIGQILKNIRKIRKLTQIELGNKLSVADNTISNYETEYSNITFEMAIKFIKECDFDIKFVDNKTKREYSLKELSKEMDF